MTVLKFDWKAFDASAGLKYTLGVAVVMALSAVFDFNWLAAGLSALLAWFTSLPGRHGNQLIGIGTFMFLGAVLTVLTDLITGSYWPWIFVMLLVAFAGTFAMKWGIRAYMVGWCLICWFYCTALLGADNDLGGILAAHFVGSGVVFVLIAVSSLLFSGTESEGDEAPGAPPPSTRFVFEYSLAVGLAMAVGLALGDAWLTTDPTLILNATLMIIFPSLAHTWTLAVDRFIGAVLGIVFGFSLGFLIQHPWLEPAIWLVFSFFILAMMNVNSGAVTFFFLALFAAGWGTQGYEVGNAIANERIFAEFVGVAIAIIAVAARNRFGRASG